MGFLKILIKTFVFLVGIFLVMMPLGPALVHQDPLQKVDAVVQLLGHESTRIPEAMALLHEGYAKAYIVSAEGKVFAFSGNGSLSPKHKYSIRELKNVVREKDNFKPFWENTHIELCLAKEIMARERLSTVAVVTSPHHTRRVRFMADKIFENKDKVIVVPSRFEKTHGFLWFFNNYERKNVVCETVKNLWFLSYSLFM